ncbi:uncharacterized protein LOC116298506 [Actinia tenebrosa]|uniref:Uncharacterized protein LOC116298506 n=1 Tax=Actinia tenebrosa TaxID=6105 RepID=A0A6P8I6A6_ACTTE|nr:uncharacterized protein LOC116298506 [Actinia tenebrosa]
MRKHIKLTQECLARPENVLDGTVVIRRAKGKRFGTFTRFDNLCNLFDNLFDNYTRTSKLRRCASAESFQQPQEVVLKSDIILLIGVISPSTKDFIRMESTYLSSPVLAPSSSRESAKDSNENTDSQSDTLSFGAVIQAKVMAGRARRRKSLFETEKCDNDIGASILSHADFPAASMSRSASKMSHSEGMGFDRELIYEILEHEVKQKLQSRTYDSTECESVCRQLANAVKERISALEIKNYKIVCTFYISKRAKPSMKMDSGCAWDELLATVDKDSFVDYVFQNDSISAVGSVYGVCCEKPRQKTGRS